MRVCFHFMTSSWWVGWASVLRVNHYCYRVVATLLLSILKQALNIPQMVSFSKFILRNYDCNRLVIGIVLFVVVIVINVIFFRNRSNAMNIWSALWMLIAWWVSNRATVSKYWIRTQMFPAVYGFSTFISYNWTAVFLFHIWLPYTLCLGQTGRTSWTQCSVHTFKAWAL